MTVCVPRRPFEILGAIILEILWFVPLIFFISGIFASFNTNGFGEVSFGLLFVGGILMFFTLERLSNLNDDYHWIKWCDTNE